MKSSGVQRSDLVIGVVASFVAVAGPLFSLAVGNSATVGFGDVYPKTQKSLAVLAGVCLILVTIKAGIRFGRRREACVQSLVRFLEFLQNRRRR